MFYILELFLVLILDLILKFNRRCYSPLFKFMALGLKGWVVLSGWDWLFQQKPLRIPSTSSLWK